MKKVLFSLVLVLAASLSFAQEKNVKEAKKLAGKSTPDFAKAQELINQALTNPETQNDPKTWYTAGYVQQQINAKEMEKAYLRQPYDTLKAYSSILSMYNYFFKCDELAQIPNKKGKIKNKFRKKNVSAMMAERGNLINGGIYFFNQGKDADALKYFAAYIDASASPMFEKEDEVKNDTLVPQIAYYAALAAAKTQKNDQILKYAPFATEHPEYGKYATEFISTAYKAQGDTVKWIATLKEGVKKFPNYPFFFGNLVDYYSKNNKYDEAMQFADDMIANDPNNAFNLYVKAYLYHNMKDYDNAIVYYKKTIAVNPKHAEAYSNLGLIYCLKAQDFTNTATSDINDPKYKEDQAKMKEFYKEAKPFYEKARELKPDNKDLWAPGLYRVYYNLNMKEFDEIEKIMNN